MKKTLTVFAIGVWTFLIIQLVTQFYFDNTPAGDVHPFTIYGLVPIIISTVILLIGMSIALFVDNYSGDHKPRE